MEIQIRIDTACKEPKVVICAAEMTEEVKALLEKLSPQTPRLIFGSREGVVQVLEQKDLIRVYASGGKVFGVTDEGEYALRFRLYEMENQLDSRQFVRISNSEIVNLKKVKNFDMNFAGTICVKLENGTVTYVSRRYLSKIKTILGM